MFHQDSEQIFSLAIEPIVAPWKDLFNTTPSNAGRWEACKCMLHEDHKKVDSVGAKFVRLQWTWALDIHWIGVELFILPWVPSNSRFLKTLPTSFLETGNDAVCTNASEMLSSKLAVIYLFNLLVLTSIIHFVHRVLHRESPSTQQKIQLAIWTSEWWIGSRCTVDWWAHKTLCKTLVKP